MQKSVQFALPDQVRIAVVPKQERNHNRKIVLIRKSADALGHLPAMMPTMHTAPEVRPGSAQHAPVSDTKVSRDIHSRNGVYHPDRAALHDQIIHHFLHGGHQPEHADLHQLYAKHANHSGPKQAVFTMGGGGSGKSYYAERKFLKHPFFTHVDPDAIKAKLAEGEGRPGHHNVDANHYHLESGDVAKRLHEAAMAHGKNFVFDGTGNDYNKIQSQIQKSKEAGYKVHLHFAKVPMELALERNRNRARKVDEDVLRTQHGRVTGNFMKLKPQVDRAKVVVPMENPQSETTQRRIQKQEELRAQGRLRKGRIRIVRKATDKRDRGTVPMHLESGKQIAPRASGKQMQQASLKPHHVYRQVRDHDGNNLGLIGYPYDGSDTHAQEVAKKVTAEMYHRYGEDASNIQSRMGATDEHGKPKWVISPNFNHVARFGTAHSRYIHGDTDAFQEMQAEMKGN